MPRALLTWGERRGLERSSGFGFAEKPFTIPTGVNLGDPGAQGPLVGMEDCCPYAEACCAQVTPLTLPSAPVSCKGN